MTDVTEVVKEKYVIQSPIEQEILMRQIRRRAV